MKIYALLQITDSHGHGLYDEIVSISTDRKFIFDKATKLSNKAVSNRYSWKDEVYWIDIFDNQTGKRLDRLEFDSNGQQEGTFGKIVRNRGSKDEKIVGSWRK